MTYREWRSTSTTAQAYDEIADRCAETFTKRAKGKATIARLIAELAEEQAAEKAKRDAQETAYQRSVYRHENNLATDRQIDYIMDLTNRYVRDGDEGRIPGGRLTRQQAEELTRRQASNLIDILKEEH